MFFQFFLRRAGFRDAVLFLRGLPGDFSKAPDGQLRTVFASRNAPSIFLQPVLNVSRVWPRDLEPLGGDIDCAKSAPLREKQKHVPICPSGATRDFPYTPRRKSRRICDSPFLLYNIWVYMKNPLRGSTVNLFCICTNTLILMYSFICTLSVPITISFRIPLSCLLSDYFQLYVTCIGCYGTQSSVDRFRHSNLSGIGFCEELFFGQ